MKIIFLGIGTNLGNRKDNLDKAVKRIEEYIGPVIRSSSVYETEPWGFKSDNQFLNMVIQVGTTLTPSGLLGRVLMVEALSGRVRGSERYSSRIIDIDILLYDDLILDEESLKIPHPLIAGRKFVLVPLCEIASEMMHPALKKTFGELLEVCGDKNDVRRYSCPPFPLKGG